MNTTTEMLREGVRRLQDILASVDRLPAALRAECRPSLTLALAEAVDLARLAGWLEAHGPAKIAGISVTADGCVLRHCLIGLDAAGWPTVRPLDGQTMFADACARRILECVRAALASATAPVVLLDAIPSDGCAMRLEPADAAAVLRVLARE